MEIIYVLITGIVLCVLGILMKVGWLNFLIDRYEGFQKAIRRKKFSVDREGVSRFYTGLFFVLGAFILIVAIIGFVAPDSYELISIWMFASIIAIGITGILYLNLSNRFRKPLETS
jgi:VIT1/CCC1 family predicted Fe2+/Mn2+ transporter